MHKRVACLYRVSTKMQVEQDDIPMQKNACKTFIGQKPDWILTKEYAEKGVSGYKKTLAGRDVLKQLKQDAENGLFDVLLVFMFDRLGRREDETPFIVEWFVKKGIAVWSVKEGEQRFDSRVDKLLNYIRYWQSGGESEKTSIRVREKHSQMAAQGKFTGGMAPYGYVLRPSGTVNNKGRALMRVEIDPDRAQTVKQIFHMAAQYGYGSYRIARFLNEQGIATKNGGQWTMSSIEYMLKNPVYKGFPMYGKGTDSPVISEEMQAHLAIVSQEVFDQCQHKSAKKSKPRKSGSALILSGLVFCGHCESGLRPYYDTQKWTVKSGQVKTKTTPYYKCTYKSGGKTCYGKHMYKADSLHDSVNRIVRQFLYSLPQSDFGRETVQIRQTAAAQWRKKQTDIVREINAAQHALNALKREIIKAITDQKDSTYDLLVEMANEQTLRLKQLGLQRQSLPPAMDLPANLRYDDMYHSLSQDGQKRFLRMLIAKMVVWRDKITVHLNLCAADFPGDLPV